jgi:hypothetical protein
MLAAADDDQLGVTLVSDGESRSAGEPTSAT